MTSNNKKYKNRLATIYYLRTIEKKKNYEIQELLGIKSNHTIWRAMKMFRAYSGLSDQQGVDLINFYEHELIGLVDKRKLKATNDKLYLQYTDRIVGLQDKIAGLLKLKNGIDAEGSIKKELVIIYGHRTKDTDSPLRQGQERSGSLTECNPT